MQMFVSHEPRHTTPRYNSAAGREAAAGRRTAGWPGAAATDATSGGGVCVRVYVRGGPPRTQTRTLQAHPFRHCELNLSW